MKNPFVWIILCISAILAALLLGFQLGADRIAITISPQAHGEVRIVTSAPAQPKDVGVPITFPLNINTATELELTALPGIGEVLAGRIVQYRTQYGDFTTLEELMDVKGITQKKLLELYSYITLGG